MDDRITRAFVALPEFSVVIPCFNCKLTIEELLGRLAEVFARLQRTYEVILVDDGSPDPETWPAIVAAAQAKPVRAFRLTRNFGRTAAVLCGMEQARGKWVITMDDDLQHRPEDIPRLTAVAGHDAVVANFAFGARYHTLSQRVTSRIKGWFDHKALGKPRHIQMSPFIMIRAEIVRMMLRSRTPHPFIPALLFHVTRDVVAVAASHAPRRTGRSQFGFGKRLQLFSNLLINNSSMLMRAFALFGFGAALLSLALAVYLMVMRLVSDNYVPGWTSLSVIELFMGGMILITLGVIGEYLVRIIQLAERRPAFFVRAEHEPVIAAVSDEAGSAEVDFRSYAAPMRSSQ
jgi:dolichol-phosphate mannosyltransferase/undecaprenyl-phosphate 4-deoxy-4-formamido-L-arabinose transferase